MSASTETRRVISIPASCVAHLRHTTNRDKVASTIDQVIRCNTRGENRKPWESNASPSHHRVDGISISAGKHAIRLANSSRGIGVVRELQQRYMDGEMCTFGYAEETRSREGIERLLAVKNWELTRFQGKHRYDKTFPCDLEGETVMIRVSGTLDGECSRGKTRAVVEVKNRLRCLNYTPRDTEVCQVRLYMELTGYNHAFIFERHCEGGEENIAVVPLTRGDKPDFVASVFGDENFKKRLASVMMRLNNNI